MHETVGNCNLHKIIPEVELKFNLPIGTISERVTKIGRRFQINGEDISLYRAAIAFYLKGKKMHFDRIANYVGVKDHSGVCNLIKLSDSLLFTGDKKFTEVLNLINNINVN